MPWPFTGREDELERVRRSVAAGHPGIVVTGPGGSGKTRLVSEAVRGADCARVAGTPGARDLPFAAFAPLLPDPVSLQRALQLLSGVRLLVVDDAHLLDDASAALLHQLAVHGRTRLLVVAQDDAPAPDAVRRLWTGELLPRLALEPLPYEDTARLVAAGAGGEVEPLTAARLHRLCGGDLRLLRDLIGSLRVRGLLRPLPGTGTLAWRGSVPVTAAVRERAGDVLDRPREEREILELLAFAEPLGLDADTFGLTVLEDLESAGLVRVDDRGAVRLAHPLHGPVLRAAAGRLRSRRLARTPGQCAAALDAEAAELTARMARADVSDPGAPVGEWLLTEGEPVPPRYAAVRARYARLRGELRQAAAWAREGLRRAPEDPACRTELALAAAQSGDPEVLGDTGTADVADRHRQRKDPADPADAGSGGRAAATDADPRAQAWRLAARGDTDTARRLTDGRYDAVRLTAPRGPGRARTLALPGPALVAEPAGPGDALPEVGGEVFAQHARALARRDGAALDRAAELLQERGFLLFAAEARAQAARAHRDPRAARLSRTRAVELARRCEGARTPALGGLVLGELTARQRQIVALAASGLSNREIAERLTLSIRTVGNHLYSAYARLGADGRDALPWLLDQPEARTA